MSSTWYVKMLLGGGKLFHQCCVLPRSLTWYVKNVQKKKTWYVKIDLISFTTWSARYMKVSNTFEAHKIESKLVRRNRATRHILCQKSNLDTPTRWNLAYCSHMNTSPCTSRVERDTQDTSSEKARQM
jgi:hypothetical protein